MQKGARGLALSALVLAAMAVPVAAQGTSEGSGGKPKGGRPSASPDQVRAGGATTLRDVEALERALETAWEAMPLTQRHAVFVGTKPTIYGGYEARASSIFEPGEKLVTYVEPVGYAWKPDGNGFRFGITMDFAVKSKAGAVLARRDAFETFTFSSRFKNRELFVNVTLSLDGLPAGDYVVVYTLHDTGSSKTSSFEQPFTIALRS